MIAALPACRRRRWVFDPDTVLLLPMTGANNSTTFTDIARGGNAPHTITPVADAKIVTGTTDPWGQSNGVAYFDGSDYCSLPNSDDWNVSNNDWTIELWFKKAANDVEMMFLGKGGTGGAWGDHSVALLINSSNYPRVMIGYAATGLQLLSTSTITDTNWHHMAAVRYGNTGYLYIDGVEKDTDGMTGITVNHPNVAYSIGREGQRSAAYLTGYLSDLRFSKGIARYIDDFTTPGRLSPYL